METELTSILDKVAPLKTGHQTGPRKAKNWLSPEAVDAKKQRRRLERRWKASNAEPGRLAYRAACSSANSPIGKAASLDSFSVARWLLCSLPEHGLRHHRVRNLGVIIDGALTMGAHVDKSVSSTSTATNCAPNTGRRCCSCPSSLNP